MSFKNIILFVRKIFFFEEIGVYYNIGRGSFSDPPY